MSEKGYTSNVIGREWIETVFEPETSKIAKGRYRLLVVDGHVSHFTSQLLEFARNHQIVILCLPAHTTHRLQSK